MVQKLQHSPLDLSVTWFIIVESLRSNGVDLVDENYGWGFLFGKGECVSHHFGTIADVHLHQTWACKFEESGLRLSSTCSSHHCFARAWRPEHETSFWRPDTNILKLLFMRNWKDNSFSKLFYLFIQTPNVSIFLRRPFFNLHGPDPRIIFRW